MLAINNNREEQHIQWQTCFLAMLPEIQHRLLLAFCHLSQEAREDSIEEGIVHCLLTYVRLFEQGRAGSVSPSSLSWYAALAVKRGRPASRRMNSKDPLSAYAQLGKGIKVERLHAYSEKREEWIDMLVADKRAAVPDQVATRMDVGV